MLSIPDSSFSELESAAHEGAFGHNRRPTPTDGQCAAGNYKMGRARAFGLPVVIEQPRGTYRNGIDPSGKSWTSRMAAHYGYIGGTKGADGDGVDCFIGPYLNTETAYVINQHLGGAFDEHKVMLGMPDEETARRAYNDSYDRGWTGLHSIVPTTRKQLQWWLRYGDMSRPIDAKNLPYEGLEAMTQKIYWNGDAQPLDTTLDKVLYQVRCSDSGENLLFDAVTVAEIIEDSDGVLAFDALVTPFARLERKMEVLRGVMERQGIAVKPAALQITEPFKAQGRAMVAAIFELSDGQTVSIYFHNPDVTPAKMAPADELISWKWLLNKKDITVVVAPERGEDLNVREVARRIMALAEKNSPAFQRANAKRAETMGRIEGLKGEITSLEGELAAAQHELEVAKVAAEDRKAVPDLPSYSEQYKNYAKFIRGARSVEDLPAGMKQQILMDERLNEGEAEALIEMARINFDPAEEQNKPITSADEFHDALKVAVAEVLPVPVEAGEVLPDPAVVDPDPAVPEVPSLSDIPADIHHAGFRIYRTKMKIGGDVGDYWAVQSIDNKKREERGEKEGSGDAAFKDLGEAKREAEIQENRMNREIEQDRIDKEELAKRNAYLALYSDFIKYKGYSPAVAERVRQTLQRKYSRNGSMIALGDLLEEKVSGGGATIGEWKGKRTIKGQDGSFLDESQVTKTGIDYAEYLISKLSEPAPVVEPAAPDALAPVLSAEATADARRQMDDEITYARQGTFSPDYLAGNRDAALSALFDIYPMEKQEHEAALAVAWAARPVENEEPPAVAEPEQPPAAERASLPFQFTNATPGALMLLSVAAAQSVSGRDNAYDAAVRLETAVEAYGLSVAWEAVESIPSLDDALGALFPEQGTSGYLHGTIRKGSDAVLMVSLRGDGAMAFSTEGIAERFSRATADNEEVFGQWVYDPKDAIEWAIETADAYEEDSESAARYAEEERLRAEKESKEQESMSLALADAEKFGRTKEGFWGAVASGAEVKGALSRKPAGSFVLVVDRNWKADEGSDSVTFGAAMFSRQKLSKSGRSIDPTGKIGNVQVSRLLETAQKAYEEGTASLQSAGGVVLGAPPSESAAPAEPTPPPEAAATPLAAAEPAEKIADRALFQSVIDGTAPDMLAPELADQLEAAYVRHEADPELMALFERAVDAYQAAMMAATANL